MGIVKDDFFKPVVRPIKVWLIEQDHQDHPFHLLKFNLIGIQCHDTVYN